MCFRIADGPRWLDDSLRTVTGVSRTNDKPKFKREDVETELLAIYTADGFVEEAGEAQASSTMGLILRDTSFYAEMGGQVGDCGSIRNDDATGSFTVSDTKVKRRTFILIEKEHCCPLAGMNKGLLGVSSLTIDWTWADGRIPNPGGASGPSLHDPAGCLGGRSPVALVFFFCFMPR